MKKLALLLLCILLLAGAGGAVNAFDFGVVLDQTVGAGGISGEDAQVDYSAALIPWLSTPLGDSGDLFVSAGLSGGYKYEEGFFVPELLRSEFSWRFNDDLRLRAGRLYYADPVNFVVDGLLDGAQVTYNTAIGTFNGVFLYSGLLYKETTRILMSGEDFFSYYSTLDYDNFADTYFASRRLIMAAGWEHPALAELLRLRAAFTAQIDVNDHDEYYHSQYYTVKAGIPFNRFAFELGGVMQTAQASESLVSDLFGIALAGEIGVSWQPPTPFQSMVSFNGRFSSGRADSGLIIAFVPVTIMDHGDVLKAGLSGLSVFKLDYTARFIQELSANLAMSCFVRGDKGTYMGYPAGGPDNDGYGLGGEFFARVMWSPVSDLRLNAGAGVFLPGMGDVAPDADPLWRMELNLILTLY